jgi:hypothetical protein
MRVGQQFGGKAGPWAVVAALLLSGCFSPDLASCLSCENGGSCPAGQACVDGYCLLPDHSPEECAAPLGVEQPGPDVDNKLTGGSRCRISSDLDVTIAPAQALEVCTSSELDIALEVQGGAPPYRWFLPNPVEGLVVAQDGSSPVAHLRGSFLAAGQREVRVTVESGAVDGCSATTLIVPIEVHETPRITAAPPLPCNGQSDYRATLEGEGGDPSSYGWSVEGLPSGLASEGGEIYSAATGASAMSEPVELTLKLSDQYCAVEQKVSWPANSAVECFGIQPAELPLPCAGIPYQAQLSSSSGDPDQSWELVSELPGGLSFDASSATVSGVPQLGGELHVRLRGSGGRVAERKYELALRDSCRFAYVEGAARGGRLRVRDVFLSDATDLVLPEALGTGEAVADFAFSPDGAWLALRAGAPDGYRLYLYPMQGTNVATPPLGFQCPGAGDACSVLDYAWAPSSKRLAVALRGDVGGTQDYLSGVDVSAPDAAWPLLGAESMLQQPIVYYGELSWVDERRVALIAGDVLTSGQEAPAWATLGDTELGFARVNVQLTSAAGQLGLLPARGGFVTFNGLREGMTYYSVDTDAVESVRVESDQQGPWLSPRRNLAARATGDGRLQFITLGGDLAGETEPGVCGTVLSWAAIDGERELVMCSAVDANGAAVSEDLALVDYVVGGLRAPTVALVPELERFALQGTRRSFSPSGTSFVFVLGARLALVDTTQPQPLTSERGVDTTAPFDLEYRGDDALLTQQGADLRLIRLEPPLRTRALAGTTGVSTSLPDDIACQEDFFAAPHSWCGASSIPGYFSWSVDAQTVVFEDGARGLWITDVKDQSSPRQVTTDLASCSRTVRFAWSKPCAKSYGFQP